MKPRKSTSSFSKREKIRRKPFNRRNKRSTSLRLLYISMSYVHGETRVEDGGTTGVNPSANASWRVSLPSYARSITIDKFSRCGPRRLSSLRPSGASWACPAERENIRGRSSICGNHMNLGGPSSPGLADGLRSVFFNAPRAIGMHLDNRAVHRNRLDIDAHYLLSLKVFEHPIEDSVFGPAVHAGIDCVPGAKPRRQAPPLATMLGDVQNCVEDLEVRHAHVAALHRQTRSYSFVLSFE